MDCGTRQSKFLGEMPYMLNASPWNLLLALVLDSIMQSRTNLVTLYYSYRSWDYLTYQIWESERYWEKILILEMREFINQLWLIVPISVQSLFAQQ